jgi:preprotein translocase subunit SecD
MNKYPLWKNLILVIATVVGLLYASPNFFPQVPALQIGSNKSTAKIDDGVLKRVENALKAANLPDASSEITEKGISMKFDKNFEKLAEAQKIAQAQVGDSYTVALNSLSTAPKWMSSINALPMYLGLDLRGGVHFLMQVDMKGAIEKNFDRYGSEVRTLLRDKKVSYAGASREGASVVVRFRNDADRDAGKKEMTEANADIAITNGPDQGDLRTLVVTLKPEAVKKIQDGAVDQNMVVLRNRVNALGVAEPIIQRQGTDRIVVQLPGVQDPAEAKRVLGRTATLELRPVNSDPGAQEAAEAGNVPFGNELLEERDGRRVLVRKQVILTGDRITGADPAFDSRNNDPIIRVVTDSAGGRILRDYTRENIKQRMAILLTEGKKSEVLIAPTIQDELSSNFQISGRMTTRETNELSLLIRAGSLAAPMEIAEERTVGPSLGKENIEAGFKSVTFGLLALATFICLYYALMGMISTLALVVNLALLVAVLSMMQLTLTLPGIAAIALTLGMAIDANVLINERIREELRAGAKPQEAINAGFEKAWGTILDSNVTTLIAGVALLLFGSGPVRGFAVVHCLGILTSMFSAVFFARGIVNWVYGAKKKLDKISIGQIWKPGTALASGIDTEAEDTKSNNDNDKKGS